MCDSLDLWHGIKLAIDMLSCYVTKKDWFSYLNFKFRLEKQVRQSVYTSSISSDESLSWLFAVFVSLSTSAFAAESFLLSFLSLKVMLHFCSFFLHHFSIWASNFLLFDSLIGSLSRFLKYSRQLRKSFQNALIYWAYIDTTPLKNSSGLTHVFAKELPPILITLFFFLNSCHD